MMLDGNGRFGVSENEVGHMEILAKERERR